MSNPNIHSAPLIFNIGSFGLPPRNVFPREVSVLNYSEHSRHASFHDRYGDASEVLPKSLILFNEYENIVEAEINPRTGRLIKAVVRKRIPATDLDLVIVVSLCKFNSTILIPHKVKTVWINVISDRHFSLKNKDKFNNPKLYWKK